MMYETKTVIMALRERLNKQVYRMNNSSFEDSSEKIISLYQNGNFAEVTAFVKKYESSVTDHCKKMDGVKLQKSFYESFIFIVEDINQRVLETHTSINFEDIILAKYCLSCVRNSFYKSSQNQNLVGEDDDLLKPLINFLKSLLKCLRIDTLDESSCPETLQEEGKIWLKNDDFESWLRSTSSVCVTMFVNLMAGNSAIRKRLWPLFHTFILNIISSPVAEINHFGAALLHQFLLEDEVKENIRSTTMAEQLIRPLLKAYIESGPHACFCLYCLEIVIEFAGSVYSSWESLSLKESLLILDILITLLQKDRCIPGDTLRFLTDIFKKEADKIFRTYNDESSQLDPNVTIRITNFLGCAASSDCFRNSLQDDKSLLISSVYLLKGITEIGDTSTNFFTRVDDIDATEDIKSHPAFGFKSDLIRLIAALVYRNKENQDTVRDIDCILLILENSQYDARNPLIREASIFALRNLLEGNKENQEVVAKLQLRGTAENESLSRLGLAISIENGKVELHQK